MSNEIADIRKDYKLASLEEADVAANPIDQFTRWWNEAVASQIDEVNAMTLATANAAGVPAARIVLLKGYNPNGFIFFTNYESDKGKNLAQNPHAALVFFWKELERQIRIEGTVEKVSAEESDRYFNSRPASSRIGAWASPQSAVIENRMVIEQNVERYSSIFANDSIERPDHWGGYIVKPTSIEFWQGRSSRLHDRIKYTLENSAYNAATDTRTDLNWKIERLAP
ncbi:MAG: pyridoxamine 5'-phosphate oxidase [Bacteroidetes bacterium]|jgi:pyridoxamine 5'-phosphate oxidase|nr:pyridoxamine 5'-phosphate oxidase [Bacteroidota bacterium]